jgi:predicted DNA-binding transcriptional regulator AlpA
MGEFTGGSQTELRCAIVERLAAAKKSAPLSRRLVGEAAAACGVAQSTMWRWIACGAPPSRPRHGVVPSERAVELLLQVRVARRCGCSG